MRETWKYLGFWKPKYLGYEVREGRAKSPRLNCKECLGQEASSDYTQDGLHIFATEKCRLLHGINI